MREKFEKRRVIGPFEIKLKSEGQPTRIWSGNKEDLCSQIMAVVKEYQSEGDTLSLRQLYYQLVASEYIPNHDTVYKKLSAVKDDLCYSGILDWDAIEDRGRVPYIPYYEDSVPAALENTKDQYSLDKQKGQKINIEIWSEKDAISAVLRSVVDEYTIRLVINKGYMGSSALYEAYTRFSRVLNNGYQVRVLYFGDHDPSGLDMVRDIHDRIKLMMVNGSRISYTKAYEWCESTGKHNEFWFDKKQGGYLEYKKWDGESEAYNGFDNVKCYVDHLFIVESIGLTMKQIEQLKPPHNPAKITDPRAKWYVKQFGKKSWEVDALKPAFMRKVVRDRIEKLINMELVEDIRHQEDEDIETLRELIESTK